MNNIDRVKTFTFSTAYELANWINQNISNELRQEQLMIEGCDYHKVIKTHYQITVEL